VQTRSYVGDLVAEKNLLTDPRFEDLAIINLGELEMLEGLAEHGYGVVALLRGWKRSALRNVAFRNYLSARSKTTRSSGRGKRAPGSARSSRTSTSGSSRATQRARRRACAPVLRTPKYPPASRA
jgi:hypothetical protein